MVRDGVRVRLFTFRGHGAIKKLTTPWEIGMRSLLEEEKAAGLSPTAVPFEEPCGGRFRPDTEAHPFGITAFAYLSPSFILMTSLPYKFKRKTQVNE